MEPSDFCNEYIEGPSGRRGFYAACCRELSEATGLSERSIQNWGRNFARRPDYILNILRKEHTIRQIQKLLNNQ